MHWNCAPYKRYVPYKEIVAYGVGGMGCTYISQFTSFSLSATSFLVGSAIGITPMHLQIMGILSTILGFFLTMARSYIIDNAHSKKGKFRPYLLYMGLPSFLLTLIFVWLPYEHMQYFSKVIAVFICYNLIQVVSPFFTDAYSNLAYIMSPDSQERTEIISISQIIMSIAPTISNLVIPFLATTFTGGLNRIQTYRTIYPAFALLGLVLAYPAYGGTKECIVQARTHIANIKFFDAIRSVSKNKYFWITSLAGWLGFLEGAAGSIFAWTFVYAYPEKQSLYGVFNTLVGNAALWSMMLAPFLIRKIGKRNLQIACNLANVVFYLAMYPVFHNIWLLTLIVYLNFFVNNFSAIYNPSINADIRDYQQYLTGERIDGMFGTVGLIGSVIGIFTGLVLPAIYEHLGLKENYDVLYNDDIRNNLFRALIIASVIGSILNVIPYFFYDMTEQKHDEMVKVLRIRALFEDYGNGVLTDEDLADTIDLIQESNALYGQKPTPLSKEVILAAKALPKRTKKERMERRHAVKSAKKEYSAIKQRNLQIASSYIVMQEMGKFSTPAVRAQVRRAEEVASLGLSGLAQVDFDILKQAKALPQGNKEEKQIRKDAIQWAKRRISSAKLTQKFYPDGPEEPAPQILADAQAMPTGTVKERILQQKAIRRYVNLTSRYRRAAEPYLLAVKLLKQKENYQHYDEIQARYEQARARADEKRRLEQEEAARLAAIRKEELERLKAERGKKKK